MTRLTVTVSVLVFCTVFFAAHSGFAQTGTNTATAPNNGSKRVDAKFVGVSGGVLLGAEVFIAAEAAFGVDAKWAYLTFPLLGAAGGGVGGYFVEKKSVGGAVAMLVGGIALLIPAAILASHATAYDPEDDGAIREDTSGRGEFSFEREPGVDIKVDGTAETTTEVEARPEGVPTDLPPPPPSDSKVAPSDGAAGPSARNSRSSDKRLERSQQLRRATAGTLFYVDPGHGAFLAMPNVSVLAPMPSDEQRMIGMRSAVEVHVPLFRIDLP